jgi:hypothetical protein
MAIPQVDINHFSVATEVQTINQVANLQGDLEDDLETDATETLVAAINEVSANTKSLKRALLTFALAMS